MLTPQNPTTVSLVTEQTKTPSLRTSTLLVESLEKKLKPEADQTYDFSDLINIGRRLLYKCKSDLRMIKASVDLKLEDNTSTIQLARETVMLLQQVQDALASIALSDEGAATTKERIELQVLAMGFRDYLITVQDAGFSIEAHTAIDIGPTPQELEAQAALKECNINAVTALKLLNAM